MFVAGRTVSQEHSCDVCSRSYKNRESLLRHKKYECGIEPQFQCPHCIYRAKYRTNLRKHIAVKHLFFDLENCS